MAEIIYVNQSCLIASPSGLSGNLEWEIDNDAHMDIGITAKGIRLTPEPPALANPQRVLRYTVEETGESGEIKIEIRREEDSQARDAAVQTPSGADTFPMPGVLKTAPGERLEIPGTAQLPANTLWSFSDPGFDNHLTVTARGVYIENLPSGIYTLCCQPADRAEQEILIQSVAPAKDRSGPDPAKPPKAAPRPKQIKMPDQNSGQPLMPVQPPETGSAKASHSQEQDGPPKEWPKTTVACGLEISGHNRTIPIPPARSLLVGKKSRSGKVVDLDLGQFSSQTQAISRNHLKIWISGEYLMMKNIGSHRVEYAGQDLFPGQTAVLKAGGRISVADLVLTVVEV